MKGKTVALTSIFISILAVAGTVYYWAGNDSTPRPSKPVAQEKPTQEIRQESTVTIDDTPYPSAYYDYENDSADAWKTQFAAKSVSVSNEFSNTGKKSLKVSLEAVTPANPGNVFTTAPSSLASGYTIVAFVLTNQLSSSQLSARIFIQDKSYHWLEGRAVTLQQGSWARLEFVIPPDAGSSLANLGVQITREGDLWTGDIFIDSITWHTSVIEKESETPTTNPVSINVSNDIKINQFGYKANGRKVAKITATGETFKILDSFSDKIVFEGNIVRKGEVDSLSGDLVSDADFSNLKIPGKYYVMVPKVGKSQVFEIAEDLYDRVTAIVLDGFSYQRCGTAIETNTPWDHGPCHIEDALLWEDKATKINAIGGWHDAGDYGKYSVTAAYASAILLNAYQFNRTVFTDNQSTGPQKGNGVPDILDEIRWELEWLLKMQRQDGAIFHKLTSPTWTGNYAPDKDPDQRFVIGVSSTATADFAAVMAIAARTYKEFDPQFADSASQAAEKAWQWLADNPTIVPKGGFSNPPGINSGVYGDVNDSDERFWAAVELYVTTGKPEYHDYVKANYTRWLPLSSPFFWSYVSPIGLLSYMRADRPDINRDIANEIKGSLINYAEKLVSRSVSNPYSSSLVKKDYRWGSNGVALGHAIIMLYANEVRPSNTYTDAALYELDYIFGRNANGKSFVTGMGANVVTNPFHQFSLANTRISPIPGLMVGGPNIEQGAELSSFPAKAYKDDSRLFYANETAIDINANLLFVLSSFASRGR